jgi:hypothetical protein
VSLVILLANRNTHAGEGRHQGGGDYSGFVSYGGNRLMTTHGAERPGGPVGTSFHLSRRQMESLKLIEVTGGLVAKLPGLNKDRRLEVAGYLSDIAEASSAVRGG